MSEAPAIKLQPLGPRRWGLKGALDFSTVPAALAALQALWAEPGTVTLSLHGVSKSNSAGLALLLECLEQARAHQVTLVLENLPAGLRDLARMSNAEGLLVSAATRESGRG